MIRTGPCPGNSQWTGLIAALEQSLRLHRHDPGTLTGMDRYLHQRTGGMIGSAAIQAILDGTERITRATLESIDVDMAASTASQKPGNRR